MAWVSPIGHDDLSANLIGLEQSWPQNLPIGGSTQSTVDVSQFLLVELVK